MTHRFYAPEATQTGSVVSLPTGEATHLVRVLRLSVGAHVRVFDGAGQEFTARVVDIDRTTVRITTLERVEVPGEPRVALTLAQGMLKGRKFDTVVRDATMLGVRAVVPLLTAHTTVPDAAVRSGSAVARWQRVAIASAKQCRRAVVPTIHAPRSFDDHLSDTTGLHVVLVEPMSARAGTGIDALATGERPARVTVSIGPEGGWSGAELDSAGGAGCRLLTLGTRTLRADAAPVATLAVLLHIWGEL